MSIQKRVVISNFKICISKRDKKFIKSKIDKVLESSRWTSGRFTQVFEGAFKRYVNSPYAAAVSNGGAAIVSILQALHIPKGSIIICPTLTAPPTPHAILSAGMRVVFVDSNPDDLGISLLDTQDKVRRYGDEVKAVIAVHVGGWVSPRLGLVDRLCKKHNIFLIEDCAHAHGSFLNGRHAGFAGKAAAYSFFMTKTLTCGEGGVVTSKDKALIDEIRLIRNYGKDTRGLHVMEGFNYRLSEFNAVVAYWASLNARRLVGQRRRLASNYDKLLQGINGISPVNVPKCQSGYYKYIITLKEDIDRDTFKKLLFEKYGVETAGGVYDLLCHQEPYFKRIPEKVLNADGCFPLAEEFSKRQVCLPLYPGLSKSEQGYIADSICSTVLKF